MAAGTKTTTTGPRRIWSDAVTEADTGTTKQVLDIPAETLVSKVGVVVTEAFAGGTPSLDIGDGDDVDGWVDSTEITETTIGHYGGPGTAGHSVYTVAGGKYYPTADTIDAVIAAAATDGTAYVYADIETIDEIV